MSTTTTHPLTDTLGEIGTEFLARTALDVLPEIVQHVRHLSITARTERGETDPRMCTPFPVTVLDDADRAYAYLAGYGLTAATVLHEKPAIRRWEVQRTREGWPAGFRPGTSSPAAGQLTARQAGWFLARLDRLPAWLRHDLAHTATGLVKRLDGRYPRAPRPKMRQHPRPCPLCEHATVMAWWQVDDDHPGIRVTCQLCGWAPEEIRPEWLS